jgi:hypothetical protein
MVTLGSGYIVNQGSSCLSYSCVGEHDNPLPYGACAMIQTNPLLPLSQDKKYKFSKVPCASGMRCPFELLSSTNSSVTCVLDTFKVGS